MPMYKPERYREARVFLDRLNLERVRLPSGLYLSLKSQALSGDLAGASARLEEELEKIGRPRGAGFTR